MFEHKIYSERVRRYVSKQTGVLEDAYTRIGRERKERGLLPPDPGDIQILSWPQRWPDERCGFEEPLPDARPAEEQTNVVSDRELGLVFVYHAGQFVRRLEQPGEAFWDAVAERRLPGATNEERWRELDA